MQRPIRSRAWRSCSAKKAKNRRRIRPWQRQCETQGPNEGAGVARKALEELLQRSQQTPAPVERLKKAGIYKVSRTDRVLP